ncbi:MAG TPA: hypothetical protein VEH80_10705 [Candidatus Bathyarchaeia archaeon]|nr:hypothetical protein [Candidatus Bathyarchaeia archaeon]
MSLDAEIAQTRFSLLEGFFRRRDEAGNFYCAGCLVAQLRARGSRDFSLTSVQGAVKDAFARPGELQLKLVGPCAACRKTRPCLGAGRSVP